MTKKPRPVRKQVKSFDIEESENPTNKRIRSAVLANGLTFDAEKYKYSEDWVPADIKNPMEIHSTQELIEHLKYNPKSQVEARIIGMHNDEPKMVYMNRDSFLEANKQRDSRNLRESARRFKEDSSGTFDGFGIDDLGFGSSSSPLIGKDFTPFLGGPFNKQLYYRDYLRMIGTCYFAYHHDPVAKAINEIISNFTMGRGCTLKAKNPQAQILWDAFCEANDIQQQMDYMARELSAYGEIMWWWLPQQQTRISFQPIQGEKVPTGIIPRVRLIDPSNIAEIITLPEDMIKGVLYYVWLAPTQYQMYTRDGQPSAKFIYTQIPAEQVMHFKVNSFSNEKRGRGDYFPALGYGKRLRDSVNYKIVQEQKNAAWSIDTVVQGNDQDIADYIQQQQQQGQYPTAGSEFVHTDAITRTYLNNVGGKSAESASFNWCLNMICMATGIPMSYLGTHLSGGNTRASALVSTEPVAKNFERRRGVFSRMYHGLFTELMRRFGMRSEYDLIWPELITQDRSAKLKDLMLAETSGWIAPSRAASMAAEEFEIKDYDYVTEKKEIDKDGGIPASLTSMNPLTTPGQNSQPNKSNGSIPSTEKKQVKTNLGQI